jgi:hypothetical protein
VPIPQLEDARDLIEDLDQALGQPEATAAKERPAAAFAASGRANEQGQHAKEDICRPSTSWFKPTSATRAASIAGI